MCALRIGWVGFHQEGVPALDALIQRGGLVGAITLSESRAAQRAGAVDVASICSAAGIPVTRVDHINDADAIDTLRSWDADVIFVIGWSQILGQEALNCARIGTIGAHASLLPHNRGSAPVNWAIIRGESEGGNSLMWLDADVDNGDLVDQRAFAITPYDTCATVYDKVAATNRDMILAALDDFEQGRFSRTPQRATDESLLPRRRPADGLIDWRQDGAAVARFVRALTRPYPGAFSHLDGDRYTVWDAVELSGALSPAAEPGEIVGAMRSATDAACGLLVACDEGLIGLRELESEKGLVLRGPALADRPWIGKVFGPRERRDGSG